jgi:lipopolysaccharide transport system permease protein
LLRTLYRFKWLLYELVVRDLVARYRGSTLGFFWTLLNPLLFMAVYTLVFSVFLRIGMQHFVVYLIAGLMPFQWFSNSIILGTSSITDGGMYVGKTVFAPAILIAVPVLSNFVNFLFSLPVLLAVALLSHVPLGWPLLSLPLLLGIQVILTFGLLLFLATFNVFFRDLQQLVGVLTMLLMYLAPIVYPISMVPQGFRMLILANPLTSLIMSYQAIFYYDRFPDGRNLLYALAWSAIVFLIGRAVFMYYKDSIPEYV